MNRNDHCEGPNQNVVLIVHHTLVGLCNASINLEIQKMENIRLGILNL